MYICTNCGHEFNDDREYPYHVIPGKHLCESCLLRIIEQKETGYSYQTVATLNSLSVGQVEKICRAIK